LATLSLSTAKPRRKKEFLNESPATCTPNGPELAHGTPNQRNYKFLRNRRLSRGISFLKRLFEGRNCAKREISPCLTSLKKRGCHQTRASQCYVTLWAVVLGPVSPSEGLWTIIARPGRIGVTRELIVQNSSLRGGDHLIHHAAPANLATNQGRSEIQDVKKRNEDPKDNIDPRLAHDLRPCRG
jgi:hypothetical protein